MSRLGRPHVHHVHTDSTNLRARELAERGAPHGTLVTAGGQSAGRGRQGRSWIAPAGSGLLMSVVLRDPPALVSLAAGVAVAETAVAFGAREVAIKWPNDVWVAGAKVAGILVEGRPQRGWSVLGIGVNVALADSELPNELRGRVASLGLERGAVDDVRRCLLEELETWLARPTPEMLEAVRARDALRGRPLAWAEGAGTGAGIGSDGRLLVDTPSERVALEAGEVHLNLG